MKRTTKSLFICGYLFWALAWQVHANPCLEGYTQDLASPPLAELTVTKVKNKSSARSKTTVLSSHEGVDFVSSLKNHNSLSSTTTFRVEEKAVISEQSLKDFFERSQEVSLPAAKGGSLKPEWSMRDELIPGFNHKTITEYGKKVEFEEANSGLTVNVKPRFRKYFRYSEKGSREDLMKAQSIFTDKVAFELKMKNIGGLVEKPQDGGLELIGQKDSVFKPRIFITDDIADQVKRINGNNPGHKAELKRLEAEVLAANDELKNTPSQVSSFFRALEIMLEKDPDFLHPKTVVSYDRTSYKFKDSDLEYQFTVDRNIQIFSPSEQIQSHDMNRYLIHEPVFETKPGELFAELKSPISLHRDSNLNKGIYQHFYDQLMPHHIEGYDLGKGKYALGEKIKSTQAAKLTEVADLRADGPYFWLIKNTGHLPSPPKPKDIIQLRNINVAIPFEGPESKPYRVVFNYMPNNVNGVMGSVLKKVHLVDEFGNKVDANIDFRELVLKAQNAGPERPLSINVNGQEIPFLAHLSPEVSNHYVDFFSDFFYNPGKDEGFSRSVEQLLKIRSPMRLQAYALRLKYSYRPSAWMMDRLRKEGFGNLLLITSIFASPFVYKFLNQDKNKNGEYAQLFLKDINGNDVPLALEPEGTGYILLIPKSIQDKINKDTKLYDDNGQYFPLKLKEREGMKYFDFPEKK